MTWKVGDWCFFGCELHQIVEVEPDGRVISLSNGFIRTSTHDARERCFPLSLRHKSISDSFRNRFEELMRKTRHMNLNFPDFYRYRDSEWERAMRIEDDDARREVINKFYDWCCRLEMQAMDLQHQKIDGIPLFNRP